MKSSGTCDLGYWAFRGSDRFTAGRRVSSPLRTTGCLKSQSIPGCELPPWGFWNQCPDCAHLDRRASANFIR